MPAMSRSGESAPFQITNSARVWSDGKHIVLEVDGQKIEMSAGEGYVISQALGRASFDALDEGIKEQFPDYEPDSERGAPSAGDGAIVFRGIIFGGGKNPPPPPPPDWDPGLLGRLIGGSAEVIAAPAGDWEAASGGWIMR